MQDHNAPQSNSIKSLFLAKPWQQCFPGYPILLIPIPFSLCLFLFLPFLFSQLWLQGILDGINIIILQLEIPQFAQKIRPRWMSVTAAAAKGKKCSFITPDLRQLPPDIFYQADCTQSCQISDTQTIQQHGEGEDGSGCLENFLFIFLI